MLQIFAVSDGFLGSFSQGIGESKSPDLDEFLIGRSPDTEGFDTSACRDAVRDGSAARRASDGIVEPYGESVLAALPAENIAAGRERDVGDGDGGLNEKVVRVFAVCGVACSDKDDPGDELALGIDDAGCGAHLGFDTLFFHGGACGQSCFELGGSGGAPGGFRLRLKRRQCERCQKGEED